MNICTFTFLAEARRRAVTLTHVVEFTDNSAAEASAERGKPHSPKLEALIRSRYDEFTRVGIFASAERVASVDNDLADGLSRGGEKLADALRMAAASGLPIVRLEPLAIWRDLSELLELQQLA